MKIRSVAVIALALAGSVAMAQSNPKFAPYATFLSDLQTNTNTTGNQIKNPDLDYGVGAESDLGRISLDVNGAFCTENNKLANGGYGAQAQGTVMYSFNDYISAGTGAFWQLNAFSSFKAFNEMFANNQSVHPFVAIGFSLGKYTDTFIIALPLGVNGNKNERIFTDSSEYQMKKHMRVDTVLSFNHNDDAFTATGTPASTIALEVGSGVKYIW